MVKYIRDVTTEMYFKIWSMYGEILGEKNLHFEGKLKTVYDMTINELILKAPAMKREHRDRLREQRRPEAGRAAGGRS